MVTGFLEALPVKAIQNRLTSNGASKAPLREVSEWFTRGALWHIGGSLGGGRFLMGEVPLYGFLSTRHPGEACTAHPGEFSYIYSIASDPLSYRAPLVILRRVTARTYRGASHTRNSPPQRTTIGP